MKIINFNHFSNEFRLLGVDEAIDHTLRLGFEGVEFLSFYNDETPLFENVRAACETKKALDKGGVAVGCYSMLADLTIADPELCLNSVFRNIEYAAALEAPYFHHTLIPYFGDAYGFSDYSEALSSVLEKAERIAEYCEKYGITTIYEPQGKYINGVFGLGTFLDKMKKRHSNVGVCGDTGNSYFVDETPENIFLSFAKDIKHIHIKDYLVKEPEEVEECGQRSIKGKCIYSTPLGEGNIDFKKLFSSLYNYDGYVSLEFVGTDDQMKKSVDFIRDIF